MDRWWSQIRRFNPNPGVLISDEWLQNTARRLICTTGYINICPGLVYRIHATIRKVRCNLKLISCSYHEQSKSILKPLHVAMPLKACTPGWHSTFQVNINKGMDRKSCLSRATRDWQGNGQLQLILQALDTDSRACAESRVAVHIRTQWCTTYHHDR